MDDSIAKRSPAPWLQEHLGQSESDAHTGTRRQSTASHGGPSLVHSTSNSDSDTSQGSDAPSFLDMSHSLVAAKQAAVEEATYTMTAHEYADLHRKYPEQFKLPDEGLDYSPDVLYNMNITTQHRPLFG